jgi:hypothetical protein
MATITDRFMKEAIAKAKPYCVVILKTGPEWESAETQHILWEHARRNFELRSEKLLPIVCPIANSSDIQGIGIFVGTPAEVQKIMDFDPAVMAKVLTYEIHTCKSFPGDQLP